MGALPGFSAGIPCEAACRGDPSEDIALHQSLHEINQAVFFDTNPPPIAVLARAVPT